jgi:hypothetical protein
MDSHTYMGGWVGGCRMQGPMYVCDIHTCRVPCMYVTYIHAGSPLTLPLPFSISFSTQDAPSFPLNPSLSLTLPPPLPSAIPIPLSTIPSLPPNPSPPAPPLFRYLPRIELGLRRVPPPLLPPFLARFARVLQPHRPSERREQTRRRRTQAQHTREPRDSTTQSPVWLCPVSRGVPHLQECVTFAFITPILPRQVK